MAFKRKPQLKKVKKFFTEQTRRTARIHRLKRAKRSLAMRHEVLFHTQQEM
ncbi:hypothetical protein [Lonepinella sp. BR2357]|uniref:hypothetical protein n=1 Tax=Lonepinella sp. BR2357 TaxID=3434549 RepID=UPI003F6E2D2E